MDLAKIVNLAKKAKAMTWEHTTSMWLGVDESGHYRCPSSFPQNPDSTLESNQHSAPGDTGPDVDRHLSSLPCDSRTPRRKPRPSQSPQVS
jgi:hypothetical protein